MKIFTNQNGFTYILALTFEVKGDAIWLNGMSTFIQTPQYFLENL